jgi:uncharacterized protein YbjT (DUF2867 family)
MLRVGLGHVEDLAVAMANCIGREDKTNGKVYNVQNTQAVTFDGVAKAAGKVIGKDVEIIHYNPKEFTFPEGKKASAQRQLLVTCLHCFDGSLV